MNIKKFKFNAVTAITVAFCVSAGIQTAASAKTSQGYFSYPMNLDFEDDYARWALGWGMAHETEKNEKYGRALKLYEEDSISVNFGDSSYLSLYYNKSINSGKHILEFDFKIPQETSNMKLYIHSVSDSDVTVLESQKSFIRFKEEDLLNAQTGNVVKSGVYRTGEWAHCDMMFDLDSNTVSIYVNGNFTGLLNLSDMSIHGFARLSFEGRNINSDFVLLDNVIMYPTPANASVDAEYTREGKIKLTYSESIPNVTAKDFVLSSQAVESGNDINFSVEQSDLKTVYLIPEQTLDGYEYTVKTNSHNLFGRNTDDVTSYAPSEFKINEKWDFENGFEGSSNLDETLTLTENEEFRGTYLKFTGEEEIKFQSSEVLYEDEYIFSYDVKSFDLLSEVKTDLLDENGFNSHLSILWKDGKLCGHANSGKLTRFIDYPSDTWFRIDNIVDITNKTAEIYLDGEYVGTVDAYAALPEMNKIETLTGGSISGNNLAVDNVRLNNVSGNFYAEMYAEDNKLYIDFNETSDRFSAENFKLKKSSKGIAETEIPFELVYQNKTRAVLQIENDVSIGETYIVEFNGIKSFLDKELTNSTASFTKAYGPEDYLKIKEIDFTNNTVTAVVENISTDVPVAIQVLRPDKELTDIENEGIMALCYIAQPPSNGEPFEFTFPVPEDGLYKIYANVGGEMIKIGSEVYHKLGAKIELTQNGTQIKSFSELKDNVPLVVTLSLDNVYKNECDYMLACGLYKGGKLVGMQSVDGFITSDMSTDSESLTISIGKTEEFDRVKVFAWRDMTKLTPIMQNITLSE